MRKAFAAALVVAVTSACGTKSEVSLGTTSPTPTATPSATPTPVAPCDVAGAICSVGPSGVGDGLPFLSASLAWPYSIARDASGNLYIADTMNARIRRVDAATGIVTTIAGNGDARGPIDTGVPATEARIGEPTTVAVSSDGWIYFASPWYEQTIFGIDPATGLIGVIAGNGNWGAPVNGPATESPMDFDEASHLSVDAAGNIFLPDTWNHVIRVINRQAASIVYATVTIPAGSIMTVAGTGSAGTSVGGSQALSTPLQEPAYALPRTSGAFFISDGGNHRIVQVATTGVVSSSVGSGTEGFSGDGGALASANLDHPAGIASDNAGHLWINDSWNQRIRLANFTGSPFTFAGVTIAAGTIDTVAGYGYEGWLYENGSNARSQGFSLDSGEVLLDGGNAIVVDTWNGVVRKIDSASATMSVIGGFASGTSFDTYWEWPGGIALLGTGGVLVQPGNPHLSRIDLATDAVTNFAGSGVYTRSGDGGPATAAGFSASDVAATPDGTVFVADDSNHVIRMIDPSGTISTFAGTGGGSVGGDGSAAVSATFAGPDGVAVDSAGNLFVIDSNRIRFINRSNAPITLCNVTIAPGAIDRIAGTGATGSTGDGGSALLATFQMRAHNGLAKSGASLFVSDYRSHRIRVIDLASGVINAFAGSGTEGYRGDGGPAAAAWIGKPTGLAVYGGALYWAQENGSAIRRVSLTGGAVETIAGGHYGYAGDGGPAREAQLLWPQKIAIASDGTIYVADSSHRVRRIRPPSGG